jgi:hypothetical protein
LGRVSIKLRHDGTWLPPGTAGASGRLALCLRPAGARWPRSHPHPIEERKRALERAIGKPRAGILINATYDGPADIVFHHVCKLGCEGIVSKRLSSRYRNGHSRDWIKSKNR